MDIKSLINKFTIYHYMISFLIILHLISAFFYGFRIKALFPVLITIITTITLDLLIEYFKSKTSGMRVSEVNSLTGHYFSQSALISGLFIGGLLTQNLQWYVYVLAGIIAILSKHLIKFQQKHIFNPANLGVLLVSIVFNAPHTWWISSPLFLVLIFGIFIIWRLKRFDLTLSFLISYYVANSVIELLRGAQFSEIYYTILNGGIIFFFSMYMLIEPKTHPSARKQRIIYGVLVAVLLILFSQYPLIYKNQLAEFFTKHGLPLALAVGNVFVPILNRWKFGLNKNT